MDFANKPAVKSEIRLPSMSAILAKKSVTIYSGEDDYRSATPSTHLSLSIQSADSEEKKENAVEGEENDVEDASASLWHSGSVDEDEMGAEEEEEEQIPFVSVFERLDQERDVLERPEPITEAMLADISVDLGQIRLCWPKKEQPMIDFMPNVILPDGYVMNTNKEKVLLLYCENFRVQYHARFPNRKPLFLCGDNVVGQRKMVCTALRPTTLPHPDLSTWQEMASFVADHITYEPFDEPTKLKSRLLSPHTVFTKKYAHSFEMSNALCSILLGRNYNAFVVYGFATRDVTENIMERTECPFEEQPPQQQQQEQRTTTAVVPTTVAAKYTLPGPRVLQSEFVAMMAAKEVERKNSAKRMAEAERAQRQRQLEEPPFDELHGRRIHGWVLMMPMQGNNDAEAEMADNVPFFIESSTGDRHEVDSPLYCSIQSVWNNVNYWVNVQDDAGGIGRLSFDFADVTKWEHILPGEPIDQRVHPPSTNEETEDDAAKLNRFIGDEKHLDMPEPWSLRIHVNHQEVTNRFPTGCKRTFYKRTLVERFSPYAQDDGLVMRIHRYADLERIHLIGIEERFRNRSDKLSKVTHDPGNGHICEHFERGRDDNVRLHTFFSNDNALESWRSIDFYHASRFDCLQRIDHGRLHLTENYVGREDLFVQRRTAYAPRGYPPPGFVEGPRRIIAKIVEEFERNVRTLRASDDVATREFDYVGRKTSLQFHYDAGKITASTRVFRKPPPSEMVDRACFRPELTHGYQAEIGAKPPKNSTLYALWEALLKDEEESCIKVRHVEDAVATFIRCRAMELMYPKLDVGLFNREQNEANRRAMLEKEAEERTKKEREIEEQLDYIRPYLERNSITDASLTYAQAAKVRTECIREFKAMWVKRANDLQMQFQNRSLMVRAKREWYNQEVEALTFEEEQDYFRELNEAHFVLHCMELRLNRLKELMPSRFDALLTFLEVHPKLQNYYKRQRRVFLKED